MNNLISIFMGLLLIPIGVIVIILLKEKKYSLNKINKDLSGFEIANKVLEDNKKNNVYIVENKGFLSDMYDYNRKVIRLSEKTFNDNSITDICISMFYALIVCDKSYVLFRERIESFIRYIILSMYLLFVIGAFTFNKDILLVAISIEAVLLIYYGYVTLMNKKITNDALEKLNKMKIIKQNEIEFVKDFYSAYYLIDITKIILNIFNN